MFKGLQYNVVFFSNFILKVQAKSKVHPGRDNEGPKEE
jgi:hypothetical protein